MADFCSRLRFDPSAENGMGRMWLADHRDDERGLPLLKAGWRSCSLSNVWFGVSAEDQEALDQRAPWLKCVSTTVRFLSLEPLLGPVDLTDHLSYVNWVIVGGESGPEARPMRPEWVRSVRDQCREACVPFFFKQWGEWGPDGKRVGKPEAGRVLDGREWTEFPSSRSAYGG